MNTLLLPPAALLTTAAVGLAIWLNADAGAAASTPAPLPTLARIAWPAPMLMPLPVDAPAAPGRLVRVILPSPYARR